MLWDAYRRARLAFAGAALLLAACSGGGSGDSSGGLAPPPALGLTVNPTSVAFAAVQNGPLPNAQSVQITLSRPDASTVTAGLAPSISAPAWLTSTPVVSGSGSDWTLSGGVTTTALAPGTYTTTVRISAMDATQTILAFRDLQVSYTVQPPGGLAASPTSLTFGQLKAAPAPAPQNIGLSDVSGTSYAWSASIVYLTGSAWLNINGASTASGSSLPASLAASVIPPAGAGTFSALIRLSGNGQTFDVPVSYTVSEPILTASRLSLAFNALASGPSPATQDVALTLQAAASVAFTTTATYGAGATGWLTVPASGAAPRTVTVGVNTTNLAPGTYTANLAINTATQSLLISVTYTVSEPVVSASLPSLSFSALRLGLLPPAQSLPVTTQGGIPVAITVTVNYLGASGWLNVTPTSGTAPATISAGVNTASALAPGFYSATIVIRTPTRTVSVPVTYALNEPTLTRSAAQLTFNAFSTAGTAPATQDVTLSTQQNLSLAYSTSIGYGAGATGWLSAPASGTAPGTISIGVNTTDLVPGTYTATLVLATATQAVSIGVSYVVATSSLTFSPSAPSFTIDTTSPSSALSKSVGVGSTGVVLNWTAASSQPWLTVSPSIGASGTSVTVSVDQAQLDTLDAGTRSATITFSYTPPKQGSTSAPLPVSLDLRLPKVNSVNPYVATSGTSLEVILRGSGFNSTAGAPVNFDSTPVSGYTVVSDTEVRVTHPSLAAGPYPVTFTNQLGLARSNASLVVVDAPVYAATTIAYPPIPSGFQRVLNKVFYDAERKAIIVHITYVNSGGFSTGREIQRYAFDGLAWSATPTIVPVGALFGDVARTLDGKKLLVTWGNAIQELDMATLAAGALTSVALGPVLSPFLDQLAVANDGNALVTSAIFGSGFTQTFKYSVTDRTFAAGDFLFQADAGGSADGSLLVLPQNGLSPAPAVYVYNASTGTLSPTNLLENLSFPVLDRRATRILLGGFTVYNRNLQRLGSIGGSSPESQTLSPDGSRAYAPDRLSAGSLVPTVLRTYDLTALPVAGQFPEVGTPPTLPSDPGRSVMTVSPDGGTLFIAGSDAIVVVPAP